MLPFAMSGPCAFIERNGVDAVCLNVGDEVLEFDEDGSGRLEIWQLSPADPSAKRLR